ASFVNREGPKLAKLVESGDANRPIPIISFIARQRDLRELVGDHVPGAEHLAFHDVLKYWEDRFDLIVLEDRNLPAIAGQRVLAPHDAAAKALIDEAFARTERLRAEVWRRLLADDGDRESFRLTYPFSPAFVKTLVALSSVLQRERTALRVM